MIKNQLEKFKKLLEENKARIEEELGNIADKETVGIEGDWKSKFPKFDEDSSMEEASNEVEEYISRIQIEQTLEVRLKKINAALKRIKKGTYGKCSNCKGETVPLKRLEVLPETDICLKCKKKK